MFFKEGFTVIGLVYKSRTGLRIYTTSFIGSVLNDWHYYDAKSTSKSLQVIQPATDAEY